MSPFHAALGALLLIAVVTLCVATSKLAAAPPEPDVVEIDVADAPVLWGLPVILDPLAPTYGPTSIRPVSLDEAIAHFEAADR